MSAAEDTTPDLWQRLADLLHAVHGDRGLEVAALARSKDMNIAELEAVEIDGRGSAWLYPVLRFASPDPLEVFVFSPQGALSAEPISCPIRHIVGLDTVSEIVGPTTYGSAIHLHYVYAR